MAAIASLSTIAYVCLAYITISYIRSYLSERRFREFARQNGCEEPRRNDINKLPWGLDGLFRVLRAAARGADLLDDIVMVQFQKLAPATTTVGTGLFGHQIFATMEPRNIQALLATKFKDFGTGERRSKQFGALLGKNIFTSDGESWAHSRAMMRPAFNRENINNLEETDRAARILMDVLPKGEGRWTSEVNLIDNFYRFTLDTATAFLFGHTTDSQLAAAGKITGKPDSITNMAIDQEFVDSFTVAQEWLSWRIRLQGLYWIVQAPKWWRATRTVRKFVNHYVQMALENQKEYEKAGPAGEEEKFNLLRELATECRDPIELRDQLLGILGAGRDTTAALLGWLFCELARNPEIYAKLRRCILEDFGAAPTTLLTFSKLKSCRYLQYCISETLRLYPPVPLNNRQATANTILPVGGGSNGDQPVAIRKGQIVNFVIYGMHRRTDIWGEDALEFKPERWEGRKIDWSFLPFSGGPRVCLGQQYAITETSFLVVRMVQTYDQIEWLGNESKVKKGFTLIMYPKDGVPVRLRRAE